MTLPTLHPVSDTLRVIVVTNPADPHLLIERLDGGLVRVELYEARRLACALLRAYTDFTESCEVSPSG